MRNKSQPNLQYIASTDVNKVLFNTVFAFALTKAKMQTLWWAQWRRRKAWSIC
jgi:hypothetical protein